MNPKLIPSRLASHPARRGPRLFPRLGGGHARAFSLMELLVAITIISVFSAISAPAIGAMLRDMRFSGAVSRLKAGLQQTRNILTDFPVADFSQTFPTVAGATYTGTALVVRWDDASQEYEVFYAISAQTAKNPALAGSVRTGLTDPANNPKGYLATAQVNSGNDYAYRGYSRFGQFEPFAVGGGIRLAGLRRKSGFGRASSDGQTELEIVNDGGSPVSSFAVCMDPTGVGIPSAQAVYVNLQEAPPDAVTRPLNSPWNVWDTTMYDASASNTGAYASTYVAPTPAATTAGKGEGFCTSLPILLVYRDDDLPLSGNAPSGKAWRKANAAGAMVLNPDLDPNEVLAQTKGHLVTLALQGGSPSDY